MPKWFGLAPLILLLAGCSRTVPCTDASQTASAATAKTPEKPAPNQQSEGAPAVKSPSQSKTLHARQGPHVSHVEREPVSTGLPREPIVEPREPISEPRESIGEADRMMPPPRMDIVIPEGTSLQVRINSGLDTRTNRAGDGFSARLMRPVTINGKQVVPNGTTFTGHVTNSSNSGRFKARATLAVTLDSFRLRGEEYRVATADVSRESVPHKTRNPLLIGGSGLSAAIGAIKGSGKDADSSAVAGGGMENTGAAPTGKLYVVIAPETILIFKLKHPLEM